LLPISVKIKLLTLAIAFQIILLMRLIIYHGKFIRQLWIGIRQHLFLKLIMNMNIQVMN